MAFISSIMRAISKKDEQKYYKDHSDRIFSGII